MTVLLIITNPTFGDGWYLLSSSIKTLTAFWPACFDLNYYCLVAFRLDANHNPSCVLPSSLRLQDECVRITYLPPWSMAGPHQTGQGGSKCAERDIEKKQPNWPILWKTLIDYMAGLLELNSVAKSGGSGGLQG